ncbi:MAG: asparagine synthetase B [Chloroflexi bacterium]|nr:asparagine synthetase B [Chloroflexota bacterium]
MSGIFGLFNKDGAPVEPATLETMRAAMAYWGPDGSGLWCEGPCGLGQLLLYNTPEALHERLPQVVDGGRLAITAEARLDNRDELCDRFAIPAAERHATSDGDLILEAYRRWGEDAPNHLFGDWSFAVWDARERRLFLARDHHGITALYTVDTPRFFAFASSQKALLAMPDVPRRLNELKFAQRLVYWEGDPQETLFQGIRHLLPAHTLAVTPQSSERRRYWRLEDAPEVRLPTEEAYAEGLWEVLERTVRSQMRSHRHVGLSLSGGLDSGGLAAIAAPILAEQEKPLFTYTAIPMSEQTVPTGARVADESPWARATVGHVGNIRDHYLDFAQTGPVEAVQQVLEILDTPTMAWGNAPWLLGIRELAREQDVGTMLNGFMGNATASWRGQLRSQSWPSLLRYGRWKGGLRDKLLPYVPYGLVRQVRHWRFGREYWQTRSAIHPEFARRMRLAERIAAADHDLTFWLPRQQWLSAREQRLSIIKPEGWRGGAQQAAISAWYGLETRVPLADARLMAYCLGIPDRHFYNGMARGLYRRALAGRLPEEVLGNDRRGFQGADFVARIRAHRAEVERTLALVQSEPAVTAYVDTTRLQAVWAGVSSAGVTDHDTWMATRLLIHGLACSLFLCRMTEGGDA